MEAKESVSDPSYDDLILSSFSTIGLYTGNLVKQGGIVKNFKLRYFSLTWNFLSYYEPSTRALAGTVPMTQCEAVTGVASSEPWTFHLVTPERTYLLQAQSKVEQRGWVEALKAVIAVHQGDGATEAQMGLLKEVAFRCMRMLHGVRPLSSASKALRGKTSALSSALFALMVAVALRVTHLVCQSCEALRTEAYELKALVPANYRLLPDIVNFDVGQEVRLMVVSLVQLAHSVDRTASNKTPMLPVEEDVRPCVKAFLLSAMQLSEKHD